MSQERFGDLFGSMPEGCALHEIVVDGNGRPVDYRFLDINPAFERLTGLRRAGTIGRLVTEVLPGIEPFWIETYGRVALTGDPTTFERYFPEPLDRTYQIYAYRPAPRRFAVIFMDITARKRLEDDLQTALHRMGTFIANMHGSILLVGSEGVVAANQEFCDYFELGESPENLVGARSEDMIEKVRKAYLEPDREVVRVREILDRGEPVIGEEVAMRNGRTCLRDFIPIYEEGRSHGLIWQHRDITERRRAESALQESHEELESASEELREQNEELLRTQLALQESEELFRIVASSTPDHVLVQDGDLRYTMVINPQMGLSERDMIGKTDYA
jgi:PAS domain-containing protein